jgi:hypothetical protein
MTNDSIHSLRCCPNGYAPHYKGDTDGDQVVMVTPLHIVKKMIRDFEAFLIFFTPPAPPAKPSI